MIKLLGISGSLRARSFNTALLRAAQAAVPEAVELDAATLHGIPLYDGDEEKSHGAPEAVRILQARILAADGLLLCTPEYNNGVPGVFKNAVDWLSSSASGAPDVFRDRPVAVIGASPGGFGTILSQNHWMPVLRALRVRSWHGGRLMVSRAASVFAADGSLQDESMRRQLGEFMQGFASFVAANTIHSPEKP